MAKLFPAAPLPMSNAVAPMMFILNFYVCISENTQFLKIGVLCLYREENRINWVDFNPFVSSRVQVKRKYEVKAWHIEFCQKVNILNSVKGDDGVKTRRIWGQKVKRINYYIVDGVCFES